MNTITKKTILSFSVIFVLLASVQVDAVEEYAEYCAVCHGVKGEGDGPLAAHLTISPSNLTLLSKKNGGSFPETMLYRVIDGREIVVHHGTREMPVWGRRFLATDADEAVVEQRINRILQYLESIQYN